MIHWLIQTTASHPFLKHGLPPPGLLAAEEYRQFSGLKMVKRRRDWLLGRWTAKHLLQILIEEQMGWSLPCAMIGIERHPSGAPVPRDRSGILDLSHLSLSISHSQECAFCAVALGKGWALGADLERIEPRSEGFAEAYCTPNEIKQLERAPSSIRDTLVNALWSAKEAVLKALQVGLSVDTRKVDCSFGVSLAATGAWQPFTAQFLGLQSVLFTGWWQARNEYVLTLAVTGQSAA